MLENVRTQIERLIASYEAEKAQNEKLRAELRACEETGAALRKQISNLESEINARKLSEAFAGGGDTVADVKAKVDNLIREIDKCISYLEEA